MTVPTQPLQEDDHFGYEEDDQNQEDLHRQADLLGDIFSDSEADGAEFVSDSEDGIDRQLSRNQFYNISIWWSMFQT